MEKVETIIGKEYKYNNFVLRFRLFGEELVLDIYGKNSNGVSIYFRDIDVSQIINVVTFDKRKLDINIPAGNMRIVTIGGL